MDNHKVSSLGWKNRVDNHKASSIRHYDNEEEHPVVREVRERKLGKPDNI